VCEPGKIPLSDYEPEIASKEGIRLYYSEINVDLTTGKFYYIQLASESGVNMFIDNNKLTEIDSLMFGGNMLLLLEAQNVPVGRNEKPLLCDVSMKLPGSYWHFKCTQCSGVRACGGTFCAKTINRGMFVGRGGGFRLAEMVDYTAPLKARNEDFNRLRRDVDVVDELTEYLVLSEYAQLIISPGVMPILKVFAQYSPDIEYVARIPGYVCTFKDIQFQVETNFVTCIRKPKVWTLSEKVVKDEIVEVLATLYGKPEMIQYVFDRGRVTW